MAFRSWKRRNGQNRPASPDLRPPRHPESRHGESGAQATGLGGGARAAGTRKGQERLACGPAYGKWREHGGLGVDAAWVVTETDGYVVNPDTLLRRWRALVKRAGVKPIPLHGARHSYATLALAAGVRLDIVSKQLGHSSVAITADVYGHADDKALEEAARKVADVLGQGRQ